MGLLRVGGASYRMVKRQVGPPCCEICLSITISCLIKFSRMKKRTRWSSFVTGLSGLGLALLLSGCGGGDEPSASNSGSGVTGGGIDTSPVAGSNPNGFLGGGAAVSTPLAPTVVAQPVSPNPNSPPVSGPAPVGALLTTEEEAVAVNPNETPVPSKAAQLFGRLFRGRR